MNGAVAEQLEQGGHVSPELFGVRQTSARDAVPKRRTALEQEARCAPQLQPRQSQPGRDDVFAPDGHRLGAIADEETSRREAGKGPAEMRSAQRIECRIDAGAPSPTRRVFTHGSNQVTSPIVDRGSTKSLDCRAVRRRA